MNSSAPQHEKLTADVERWLQDCVLGLSLCPYARVPWQRNQVRIIVYPADQLQTAVAQEIDRLQRDTATVETTLLVIADGYDDFLDFNDVVGEIEDTLQQHGLDQFIQLASFHPAFLFGGEATEDASHYTNRAPHPIVQLLRVDSVAQAVEQGDTLTIPERNIKTLRALDKAQLRALFPWV